MDSQSRDVVTWILGTTLTLCLLGGFVVRFVVFPWIQAHLVEPVKDTNHQVSVNAHQSPEPTIPDRIDDLSAQVTAATLDHVSQGRDIRALTRVLDEHLRWSNRWVDEVDDRLNQISRGTEKEE
jgi:hypothetical protein